jgi:hypothetical protein
MALASLWPGFFAWFDYYLDDRSAYEDDNELTALGLIFCGMPFALFLMASGMRREAPVIAAVMVPITLIAIYITCFPAWVDAYNLGLGPSSKADVDYLEWDKIGIWVAMLLVCCMATIGLDMLISFVARFSYPSRKIKPNSKSREPMYVPLLFKWLPLFLWSACPAILLNTFYDHGLDRYFFGSSRYSVGLLTLGISFISCFLCPIVALVFLLIQKDKLSAGFLFATVIIAGLCLAIFYYDPGHHIRAYLAD